MKPEFMIYWKYGGKGVECVDCILNDGDSYFVSTLQLAIGHIRYHVAIGHSCFNSNDNPEDLIATLRYNKDRWNNGEKWKYGYYDGS